VVRTIAATTTCDKRTRSTSNVSSRRPPPRAFSTWNKFTRTLPCPPAEDDWMSPKLQHRPARTGILYVKVPKTGSSTGSSVNLRLASRIYRKVVAAAPASASEDGNRTQESSSSSQRMRACRNRFMHAPACVMEYGQRDTTQSVLWSVVRDPTDRVVSQYFHFYVTRGGRNASDESAFRDFLWKSRESLPSV
jgi:Sulfotransferase family